MSKLLLPLVILAILVPQTRAQEKQKAPSEEQVQRYLKQHPEADTNKDGKLSPEELRASQKAVREAAVARDRPAPTAANVHYGPHERNVLDFYQAKSEKPTPLIIFIHGGGFVGGDKSGFVNSMLKGALESGISFATIHYRFVDGNKVIFPVPQMDSARALQFLRSKAGEWNIDSKRVACYGGSAGAGISMYIGFHDDLAKPDSPDPIERITTRITAIGTFGGQSTYDPIEVKKLIGGRAWEHPSLQKIYGTKSLEDALHPTPEQKKLYDECAAITHLTKDDPPLYMVYTEPDGPPPTGEGTKPGQNIHHPNFGKQLKVKMDSLGIENVFVNQDGKPAKEDQNVAMLGFFKKHFGMEK